MSGTEKRSYDGRLRAARAAQTRRRIIDVAVEMFGERGYAATTMGDLALGAGVSVDTVHANGPKSALLQAAVRVAIFGIESDQPIEDYEIGQRLLRAADPAEFTTLLVDTFRRAIPTVVPLWSAVEAAADTDADVAVRRDELLSGAVATLRTLVRSCAERGWLGGPLTDQERVAALYTVGTPGSVHLVMRDLALDGEAYQGWMRRTIEWALFGTPDRPAGGA
jgi:AcrR family transcriptional regulator